MFGRPPMFYTEMIKISRRGIVDDYKTTATLMVKLPENKRYNISRTTVSRASKALDWTFYNRHRYCNMLQISACMQYVII